MTDFVNMMEDAFARLRVQEACPKHEWTKPRRSTNRFNRKYPTVYETKCRLCGARASRPDLARLKAEIINA